MASSFLLARNLLARSQADKPKLKLGRSSLNLSKSLQLKDDSLGWLSG